MCRNNTRKPDDELITRFQQTFADIVPRRDGNNGYHPSVFHMEMGDHTLKRYEDRGSVSPGFDVMW